MKYFLPLQKLEKTLMKILMQMNLVKDQIRQIKIFKNIIIKKSSFNQNWKKLN